MQKLYDSSGHCITGQPSAFPRVNLRAPQIPRHLESRTHVRQSSASRADVRTKNC